MKNLMLFLSFSVFCINNQAQTGFHFRHHQMAMGTDTGEIYLRTHWVVHDSLYEVLLHSEDNGCQFTIKDNRYNPWVIAGSSAVFGDALPGTVYGYPVHIPDTFAVSFDTGLTFSNKYFHKPFDLAAGCQPGELYFGIWMENGLLCRSNDFGTSFDTIDIPDSLNILDVGVNPGELFFEGWHPEDSLNLVTSPDYGHTFISHKIFIPTLVYFDLCRGTFPGECYLLIYDESSEYYFYIYHVIGYGDTVTYQTTFESGFHFISYIAGRKPGSFYIALRSCDTPDLDIYYSSDYGVTFTTYHHYLDSTYTGVSTTMGRLSSGLKVFPNPAGSQVTVILPEFQNCVLAEILNLEGAILLSQKIAPVEQEVIFNTGSLSNGVYLVRVFASDGNQYSAKVVVCR